LKHLLYLFLSVVFFTSIQGQGLVSYDTSEQGNKALLNLPGLTIKDTEEPILIAVIDDAINGNHEMVAPFLYTNADENPFNKVDDDGNGAIDDLKGYDVVDLDNDPSPPVVDPKIYYHGTMTAGVIAQVLRSIYGKKASEVFKILPVKAISDKGDARRMSGGYKGIEYARRSGVDLIVCAWSGGVASDEEIAIVKRTIVEGIPIIVAGGNTFSDLIQSPADIDGVITVAAIDHNFKRMNTSAYGNEIDISYYGDGWLAPASWDDNGYAEFKNTSQASALTAAMAAAAMHEHGRMSSQELERLIKQTAIPIDEYNVNQWGMLGAGLLDAKRLLSPATVVHNPLLPEGLLSVTVDTSLLQEYAIKPIGAYSSTRLQLLSFEPWKTNQHFTLTQNDGLRKKDVMIDDLYQEYEVDASDVVISTEGLSHGTEFVLSYASTPFDSTTMYCQEINVITSDTISDGSGAEAYANGSNCKWQLYSEEGTRMKIEFDQFDTEAQEDHLYIFDGEGTLQTNLMARFSGGDIPPVIYSRSNKVLIWFVTNDKIRKGGWQFRASAYKPE